MSIVEVNEFESMSPCEFYDEVINKLKEMGRGDLEGKIGYTYLPETGHGAFYIVSLDSMDMKVAGALVIWLDVHPFNVLPVAQALIERFGS